MSANRKRKTGLRQPNGQLRRPSKAEREAKARSAEDKLKEIVLAQPHRRGNQDQRCASAIGRFFIAHPTLSTSMLHAAEEYAGLVRRWRAAKGVPSDVRLGLGSSSPDGPCEATVQAWTRMIDEINAAMRRASADGFFYAKQLVLDDRDAARYWERAIILALHAMAVEMKWMSARSRPF